MSEISVIIVSWNARGYLRDCLASVRATGGALIGQIIVVDNASSDGSAEMVVEEFPDVTLVRSSENFGFARANNLGLSRVSSPLVALVNSDVVVHPGCFQALTGFLESHPEVGLVGPKVLGRDGQLQTTCMRLPTVWNTLCPYLFLDKVFPRWPLFSGFQVRPEDYQHWAEVEVVSGCFCVARRAAVDQVGGLDERFFFYAEDWDWCKRFRDAGWRLMFVPEATATHFGGGSSANAPLHYSIEILRANLIFWKKYHGNLGRAAYYLLAMAQHGVRLVARSLQRVTGSANKDECEHKLKEHMVCLRWLLTGKGV